MELIKRRMIEARTWTGQGHTNTEANPSEILNAKRGKLEIKKKKEAAARQVEWGSVWST